MLSGCYNTPVRHLAADVGLVKIGISTKDDVLVFLGDPDQELEQEDGSLVWLYLERKKTVAERLPLVGREFGSPEETQVAVHFRDDVVSRVEYSVSDPDDLHWQNTSSWEKE